MPTGTSENSSEPSLSFAEYKIDYRHPLGAGVFGTVYPLVRRPEDEKGIFSYWCPYLYDWLFSVPDERLETSEYCVKVCQSSIRMVYENPTHSCRFRLPWHSLFEGTKERKTNKVLKKHGMSNITFFRSDSLYAEFKTLIHGHTLHHYLMNGSFVAPAQFQLRKKFVDFMQQLKDPKFTFWDLSEHNLMFDERRQQWEVIDGIVNEVSDSKIPPHEDNLQFFHQQLLQSDIDMKTRQVLDHLLEMAERDVEYSEDDDKQIIEPSAEQAFRPMHGRA